MFMPLHSMQLIINDSFWCYQSPQLLPDGSRFISGSLMKGLLLMP